MPQDPPQARPAAATAPAAEHPGGAEARHRRELLTSPLWLLAALAVHGLIFGIWLRYGGTVRIVERSEAPFAVTARPVHEPEPAPPEIADPTPEPPPPQPDLMDQPVPEVSDVAAALPEDAGGAPGPLDDTRPAGPDVFGVGSGSLPGGGGGGGGGTGSGRRSGLGGAAMATDLGPMDKGFHDFVSDLRARGLDVVFVVDCTESMQQFIDRALATIDDIIADLSAIVPDLRIGIVAYRDRSDEWVTRAVDLTDDRYRIHNFLLDLTARGGGDFEEALEEGLRKAADDVTWRPQGRRVLIVVGDAPPHAADMPAALAAARGFAHDRQSVVDVVYTGVAADRQVTARDSQARAALEKIARAGNGTLADLRSDNASLRDLIVKAAFGSEWDQDIHALLAHQRTDWRTRIVQGKVKDRDLAWLLAELRKRPVHPAVVEGVLQLFDKSVARAVAAVLLDENRPPEVRSAALYVLKRKVAPGLPFDVAQPVDAQPDAVAKLQREIDKLPDRAAPAVLPPVPGASPPKLPPLPPPTPSEPAPRR